MKYLEDGSKVRVSRGIGTSESIIPRPEILKIRTTPRPSVGIVHLDHPYTLFTLLHVCKIVCVWAVLNMCYILLICLFCFSIVIVANFMQLMLEKN